MAQDTMGVYTAGLGLGALDADWPQDSLFAPLARQRRQSTAKMGREVQCETPQPANVRLVVASTASGNGI